MFAERLPRVARNCVSRPIFLSHLETKFRDLIVKRRLHKVYLYAFPMVAVFQVFSMQTFHRAVAGFPKGISRSVD